MHYIHTLFWLGRKIWWKNFSSAGWEKMMLFLFLLLMARLTTIKYSIPFVKWAKNNAFINQPQIFLDELGWLLDYFYNYVRKNETIKWSVNGPCSISRQVLMDTRWVMLMNLCLLHSIFDWLIVSLVRLWIYVNQNT